MIKTCNGHVLIDMFQAVTYSKKIYTTLRYMTKPFRYTAEKKNLLVVQILSESLYCKEITARLQTHAVLSRQIL